MREDLVVAPLPWRWRFILVSSALFVASGAGSPAAHAQAAPPAQIYSCVDANGKRLTSDRPIPECNSISQRVLNADGSVKRVVPPTPTTDEQNAEESRQRDAALALKERQEAVRRDRNLLARFPNEAAHRAAREAALEDVRKAVRLSETRMADLNKERKPLMDETEFYVGKPLPAKLKTQLDANDATMEAQRALLQNQQQEVVRIDKRYDEELERLRRLWNGAQPGSMGVLPTAASAPKK